MDLSSIDILIFTVPLFFMSFIYSSVGHGGASGYLALMALFSFAPEKLRPIALVLNVFVSAISFWSFKKNKHFKWSLFYPFAISSIPAAFLGGWIEIDPSIYKITLGAFMFLAVLRLLRLVPSNSQKERIINIPVALLIGATIGFLSGLIGIGGGIILSPVILLLAWGKVKETAAVSALFILVNSLAGLAGQISNSITIPQESYIFLPIVLIGAYLGSKWGSEKLKDKQLNYVLALVLLVAGVKLIWV